MGDDIAKVVTGGAQITITPDCWPLRRKVNSIKVSMTKWIWNPTVTLNRNIPVEENLELPERRIIGTIDEMAQTIETPGNWKGVDDVSKTILVPVQNVSFGEAWRIVRHSLDDDSISYKLKVLAIEKIAEMETHNSITKADLVAALRWLFAHYDFEG